MVVYAFESDVAVAAADAGLVNRSGAGLKDEVLLSTGNCSNVTAIGVYVTAANRGPITVGVDIVAQATCHHRHLAERLVGSGRMKVVGTAASDEGAITAGSVTQAAGHGRVIAAGGITISTAYGRIIDTTTAGCVAAATGNG